MYNQYYLHSCFTNKNNAAQRERPSSNSHNKKKAKLEFKPTNSDPKLMPSNQHISIKQILLGSLTLTLTCWLSGLRWHFPCYGLDLCYGAGSIPGPGNSTCLRSGKQTNKQINKQIKTHLQICWN